MINLDSSKAWFFWIVLGRLVSQSFLIDMRFLFRNRFMSGSISHAKAAFYPLRVKRVLKFAIFNLLITKGWKYAKINSLRQKFDCGIYYCQTTLLVLFWHIGAQMGVKKYQKLPISLIIPPRSYKLIQIDNFSRNIWYCHLFRINCTFWLFLEQLELKQSSGR